jgi:hypothetical protein
MRNDYQATPLAPASELLLAGLSEKSKKAELAQGISVLASSLLGARVKDHVMAEHGRISFVVLFPVIAAPPLGPGGDAGDNPMPPPLALSLPALAFPICC